MITETIQILATLDAYKEVEITYDETLPADRKHQCERILERIQKQPGPTSDWQVEAINVVEYLD